MAQTSSTSADNAVAFINGRVYTADESRPWISGFIVSPTGNFVVLGEDEDIRKQAREQKLAVYNLRGRFVMPGIHDAHTHLLAASLQQLNESAIGLDANEKTLAEKLKVGACACAYAHVWGDWLIGNFYSADQFPNQQPDRKYLDHLFPDQPVIVRDTSCHNILMNTAGLQRAGYDLTEPQDPHGGQHIRRDNGELTGELIESASTKAWLSLPPMALAHVKRAILHGIRTSLRFGITSCQEASANSAYLLALRELEQEGLLTMDICTHIVCAPENFALETEESLRGLLDTAETYRSRHVHTNFVKFWLDGAPLPPHFTQCDLNMHGRPDLKRLLIDQQTLLSAVKKYDGRGMTCKIHCAGEGSVRQALDVLALVRKGNSSGPQHELAHCNAVDSDDIARFSALRVTAEMSPAIFHETELISAFPHLFKWPFLEILESGGKVTIGSDWILPPTPSLFASLAAIVDKIGSANIEKAQGKTARQAGGEILCRIITIGGAEAVGRSHETGSIAPGKRANFIVVDRDLSEGEFEGANVLQTWFEGNLVWNANSEGKHSL